MIEDSLINEFKLLANHTCFTNTHRNPYSSTSIQIAERHCGKLMQIWVLLHEFASILGRALQDLLLGGQRVHPNRVAALPTVALPQVAPMRDQCNEMQIWSRIHLTLARLGALFVSLCQLLFLFQQQTSLLGRLVHRRIDELLHDRVLLEFKCRQIVGQRMNQCNRTARVRYRLLDCVQIFAQFMILRLSLLGTLRQQTEVLINVLASYLIEENNGVNGLQNEAEHFFVEAENVGQTEARFDAKLKEIVVDYFGIRFWFRQERNSPIRI